MTLTNCVVLRDQQTALRQQLRTAFIAADGPNCWCWLIPGAAEHQFEGLTEASDTPSLPASEGVLVRLSAVNGSYWSFFTEDTHYVTHLPTFYLLQDSQFVLRWVGAGPNMGGAVLDGATLEQSLSDRPWTT